LQLVEISRAAEHQYRLRVTRQNPTRSEQLNNEIARQNSKKTI